MKQSNFPILFASLTGHPPFPWQAALYHEFVEGKVPAFCNIPTGLGKTMVIVVWLIALANPESKQPRRLVYVVNRRTIVDQATELILSIRKKLSDALKDEECILYETALRLCKMDCFGDESSNPLAVSTLRGEFADKQEWKSNPTKPAVIVGTVDMIGSKLLFSGYGDSRRTRPLHAAFLGCDTLFIHDEAHLTPAFGKLLRSITRFQKNHSEQYCVLNQIEGIKVLELSATPAENSDSTSRVMGLTEKDHTNQVVKRRLNASKTLHLHEVLKDGSPVLEKISKLVLEYLTQPEARRIVVFVRSPEAAEKLTKEIIKGLSQSLEKKLSSTNAKRQIKAKAESRVSLLTGQIRGHERDLLLKHKGMQPFLGKEKATETVFFIATSAGEIGFDLHADHMVCDLSNLDSFIQRLGRVNRFGGFNSRIDLVYEKELEKAKSVFEKAKKTFSKDKENSQMTKKALEGAEDKFKKAENEFKKNPRNSVLQFLKLKENPNEEIDASLRSVQSWPNTATFKDAISPQPETMELSDVLLDLWSQTSIDTIPARPSPECWLHGIQEDYPHTMLAWRDEVEHFGNVDEKDIDAWFRAHPICSAERLQLRTSKITKTTGKDRKSNLLKGFSEDRYDLPVLIITPVRKIIKSDLGKLIANPKGVSLDYATIIFPSQAGGISKTGFFDPKAAEKYDATDVSNSSLKRIVLHRQDASWSSYPLNNNSNHEEENAKGEWIRLSQAISTIERSTSLQVIVKLQMETMDEFSEDDSISEKWLLLLKKIKGGRQNQNDTQTVEAHNEEVRSNAVKICDELKLPENILNAIVTAAKYHDEGKALDLWQKAAGHTPIEESDPLAKGKVNWRKLNGYRHELGSMLKVRAMDEIIKHPERDLILHLIAAHHGWARPYFKPEAFPSESDLHTTEEVAYETMLRYDKLQARFGWWKLAYLESILRRADAIASADEQINMEEG